MWLIQLFFAGLWAEIWHWGVGIGAIVLLVGGAVFSQSIPLIGPYLAPIRKELLFVAAAIAILLVGEFIGQRTGDAKCEARQVVVTTTVHKKVDKATSPSKTHDPYDDPQN
jgi:hypothetical protein